MDKGRRILQKRVALLEKCKRTQEKSIGKGLSHSEMTVVSRAYYNTCMTLNEVTELLRQVED